MFELPVPPIANKLDACDWLETAVDVYGSKDDMVFVIDVYCYYLWIRYY